MKSARSTSVSSIRPSYNELVAQVTGQPAGGSQSSQPVHVAIEAWLQQRNSKK